MSSLFSLNAPSDQDDLATAQLYRDPKPPEGVLEIGYDSFGCPVVLPLIGQHLGEVWYFDIEGDSEDRARVDWFDRRDVWKLADSFAEFMVGYDRSTTTTVRAHRPDVSAKFKRAEQGLNMTITGSR